MKTINRTAITILPKKPYVDWANSFGDRGPKMELENNQATTLLIPEEYDEFNYEEFLKNNWKMLFEEELAAWMDDPELWPKNRDYATFKKWFKVIPSDIIYLFGKGPIKIEDF